jgi:hypothetical protein
MTFLFSLYHPPLSGGWYKLNMESILWAEAEIQAPPKFWGGVNERVVIFFTY